MEEGNLCFQESFECFAAASDEWEWRAEPGSFLLPRCIFSLPPIQWEVRGAATAWPMPQATLRPCLQIFQLSGQARDKAPPLDVLLANG